MQFKLGIAIVVAKSPDYGMSAAISHVSPWDSKYYFSLILREGDYGSIEKRSLVIILAVETFPPKLIFTTQIEVKIVVPDF